MSVIKFGTWQDLSGNEVANSTDPVGDGGLVHITTQTVGSGVSQVTINNVFSSSYDTYKIVYSNITMNSVTGDIGLRLVSSGTSATGNYYWASAYVNMSTNAVGAAGGGGNPRTEFPTSSNNPTGNKHTAEITIFDPFIATVTTIRSTMYNNRIDIAGLGASGIHNVSSSYDGVSFEALSGTLTGGSISVYGYRK